MRRKFALDLYDLMKEDKNIILVTADMGYGMLNKIRDDFPNQFYNVGAAEQTMMCIAVGLALEGKIPVVYSITPFLIFRPFEAIRNYLNHEGIPVIMAASGRGQDYDIGGFSHDASDHEILKHFTNIRFVVPESTFDLKELIYAKEPVYLNLKR
jgi:transketolase